MKEETKLRKLIGRIKPIINDAKITPTQYRYICKAIREDLKMQVPKVPQKLPDYLNQAEIWQLLKSVQDNPVNSVLIEFLIFTGLRIAEARSLMIEYIDFDNNQLKVVEGKGKKDRYVPITSNLQSKLRLYLNGRKKGFLFAKSNGTMYSTRALQYRITGAIDKCNFEKKLTTHSLRHTFACLCRAKGLRLEDIQILMGHASIKQTEWYGKLELGTIKDQFMQLLDMRG